VTLNPKINIEKYATYWFSVLRIPIINPICIIKPNIYMGFLPYTSPSLVRVEQPITIPKRNADPISPTLIEGSQ
jgi:hypothetical protein